DQSKAEPPVEGDRPRDVRRGKRHLVEIHGRVFTSPVRLRQCAGRFPLTPAAARPTMRAMAYEQIVYEQRDDVALVTLNRPERLNAWTPHMASELADAFARANAERAI